MQLGFIHIYNIYIQGFKLKENICVFKMNLLSCISVFVSIFSKRVIGPLINGNKKGGWTILEVRMEYCGPILKANKKPEALSH